LVAMPNRRALLRVGHGAWPPRKLFLSPWLAVIAVVGLLLVPRNELWGSQRIKATMSRAAGLCALLPAPPSAPLSRVPSSAHDRWPLRAPTVEILPEPVERPLARHLHKIDKHFDRIVPDWQLQFRTLEQQFLYDGEFSLFVREVTDQGVIAQDAVTGIFGFVPESEFGQRSPAVGDLIEGARCTKYDNTVVASTCVETIRLQIGIVYEWDGLAGEGYIIPEEGQFAFRTSQDVARASTRHPVA